jgi:hypothetical protein
MRKFSSNAVCDSFVNRRSVYRMATDSRIGIDRTKDTVTVTVTFYRGSSTSRDWIYTSSPC